MAEKPIGNMIISLGMDGTQFGNTLDDIKRQIKLAESTMKANLAVLGDAGKGYDALAQKSKDLAVVMDAERKRTEELTRRRDELIANGKAGTVQEQKLAEQINKSVMHYTNYEKQLNTTKRELAYASEGVNDLSRELTSANKETNDSVRVMKTAGDSVGAVQRQYEGLQKQVNISSRAIQAQERVVATLSSEFGESSTEVVKATQVLTNMRKGHDELGIQLDSTSNKLTEMGESATEAGNKSLGLIDIVKGNILAQGFMALASTIKDTVLGSLDDAVTRVDKISTASRALGQQLGSMKKGQEVMDATVKSIEGTPIALDSMTDGVKGFIAAGLEADKVEGLLRSITDASYGVGQGIDSIQPINDAFKAMIASGTASLGDLNRLADQNVPIFKIMANKMDMSVEEVKKAVTKGSVSTNDVIKMYEEGIQKGTEGVAGKTLALAGSAKLAGDTIGGAMSNFKTAITRGIANVVKPFEKDIQNVFTVAGTAVGNLATKMGEWSVSLRTGVIDLFSGFKEGSGDVSDNPMVKNLETVKSYVSTLILGIKSLFSGDVMDAGAYINKLSALPEGVQSRITKVVETIGQLKDMGKEFFNSMIDPVQKLGEGISKLSFKLVVNQFELIKPVLTTLGDIVIAKIVPALNVVKVQVVKLFEQLSKFFNSPEVSDFLSMLGVAFKKVGEIISSVLVVLSPVFDFLISMIVDAFKSIVKIVGSVLGIIKGLLNVITGLFTGNFTKMWDGIKTIFSNALTGVWELVKLVLLGKVFRVFKLFGGKLTGFFKGIGSSLKSFGGKMVHYITLPLKKMANFAKSTGAKMWSGVKSFTSKVGSNLKSFGTTVFRVITMPIRKLASFIKSTGAKLWSGIKGFFSKVINSTKGFGSSITRAITGAFSKLGTWIRNFGSKRFKAFNDFFSKIKASLGRAVDKIINLFKDLGKGIVKTFKDTVDWVKKFPEKLWSAILDKKSTMVKKMKSFGKAIGEGIEWGVNAGIRGINKLLHMIGVGDGEYSPIKKVKIKYARGTDNHPGGMAMVNDGIGSNYKEIVRLPTGQQFIPQGRNQVLDLPRGSQVLSGDKTAKVMGSYGMPKYNWGTKAWDGIKSAGNATKDWAIETGSKAWEGTKSVAKSVASKVTDYAELLKHPIKYTKIMVKDMLSKVANNPLMQNFKEGFGSYLPKQAKDYILSMARSKQEEEEGFADFGNFSKWSGDFSSKNNKHGVYDFLYSVAQQLMSSKAGKGLVVTSGERFTDTYDHSKGLAIDLSGWGANGGYKNIAKSMGNHPYIKYAIGDNTVFGNGYGEKGSKPSWAKGHMNHLHLSALAPHLAKKNNKAMGGGSDSVKGWTSKISKVAKAMKVKLSKTELNGILAQIQRESGGNQSITQSSAVNDINMRRGNPAQGLLQYIPSTFKTYAMKGHGNIKSGIDQLYAFFNNSTWRRDLPYGKSGWGPRGARRFANGGLITSPTLAMAGEAGTEMVIPLTRKARATQLLNQAQSMLGIKRTNEQPQTSNDAIVAVLQKQNEQIAQQGQMIELLSQLLLKDDGVYLDGKELANSVSKQQTAQQRRINQARGV